MPIPTLKDVAELAAAYPSHLSRYLRAIDEYVFARDAVLKASLPTAEAARRSMEAEAELAAAKANFMGCSELIRVGASGHGLVANTAPLVAIRIAIWPNKQQVTEALMTAELVRTEAAGRSLADDPDNKTKHSDDFTSVVWFGTEYHFALGVQSSAVRALWEEWERSGLGLHQETIRNAIDAERDSFRMDTAFRRHPAFGTMIQRCGDGRYRLAPPSSDGSRKGTESPPRRKGRTPAKSAPESRQKRA